MHFPRSRLLLPPERKAQLLKYSSVNFVDFNFYTAVFMLGMPASVSVLERKGLESIRETNLLMGLADSSAELNERVSACD